MTLAISEETLKKHRARLLRKLGAKNASQAVTRGYELGVIQRLRTPGPCLGREALMTPRETEVADLLVRGFSSKEIARSLAIADLTVRKHRENLLRKLGCRHTGQLAAIWLSPRALPA